MIIISVLRTVSRLIGVFYLQEPNYEASKSESRVHLAGL